MTQPYAFIGWPRDWLSPMNPDGGHMCVVDRWYDGDTVFVWVWLRGFDKGMYEAVRISGIWAPELNEPGGPEARDDMMRLFPRDTRLKLSIDGRSFSRVVGVFETYDEHDVGVLALNQQEHGHILEQKIGIRAKASDRLTLPGPQE